MTILRVIDYAFRRLPCALALLALAGFILVTFRPELAEAPERLPDFDYLPAAQRLADEEKYDECIQLCEDVIALKLPHAAEAEKLRDRCRAQRDSLWYKSKNAIYGFITGDASTLEAAIGAVASDMTLYGDIRDLGVQGWHYLNGEETDGVIIALSTIGLATELIDWADWLPAVLKTFKRAGVFSKRFAKVLGKAASQVSKGGRRGKAARELFANLGKLIRKCNMSRSKAILRQVDNARQVQRLAVIAERSPRQLHLACHSVGVKRLLSTIDNTAAPARALRIAAKKGPAGLRVFKVLKKSGSVRMLKWGAHLAKVFRSRHADKLAQHLYRHFPEARWIMLTLAALFFLWGILLLIPKCLWRKFRRCVSAPASGASDARTTSETPEARSAADPSADERD